MAEPMKLSLLQFAPEWEAHQKNRQRLEAMLDGAPSSDVYLLPEMFTTGFVTEPEGVAEQADTITLEWMRQMAARKGAAVAGSVAVREEDRFFNRFYFVEPGGLYRAYDKRHLFTMGGETSHYTPGRDRLVFEYMGFRIMPLICYDLRFPVWSRAAGRVDLMLYVASWPTPRVAAWDTLLRARAIENQCYVAGVNRVGNDPYNEYCGHSAVIDYLGGTLADGNDGLERAVTADISREPLDAFRQKFPAYLDADQFELR